jgi:hypothetical protein
MRKKQTPEDTLPEDLRVRVQKAELTYADACWEVRKREELRELEALLMPYLQAKGREVMMMILEEIGRASIEAYRDGKTFSHADSQTLAHQIADTQLGSPKKMWRTDPNQRPCQANTGT